jgi:hypothetical protein
VKQHLNLMKMRTLILFFTLVGITLNVSAQSLESVDWGTFKEMPEGTAYQQAVGFDSDYSYYIISDHKVDLNKKRVWLVGVSSLTNTLEQSSEILLPSVGGVQTEYENLFFKDGKFILFSSARNKNQNKKILYVSYLKQDGTLKNKPKKLASVPLSNAEEDGFNIFLSNNEKSIVIESHKTFKKYNGDKINLVILDFNLVESFNADIVLAEKYNAKEFIIEQMELDNDKLIFLAKSEVISTRRSSSTTEYSFVAFVYNTAKKSLFDFVVTMPKYKVADAKFTINKKGNIVVAGFVRGRSVKFANEKVGMFYKRYNPNTLQAIPDIDAKSYVLKFPREFLTEINKPEYGETPDVRFAYKVKSVEELANGAYIVLTEQGWVDGRVVVKAGSKEEDGIQYYHYNNIMAGGISKKGKFEWIKIYPKAQLTTNDKGYYSSFKTIKIGNKLKLFYNGNKSNLHTGKLKKIKEFKNNPRSKPSGMAGVYTIYVDGSYERDPMFPGKDNNYVMIPHTLDKNSVEYGVGVVSGDEVKFGSFVVE